MKMETINVSLTPAQAEYVRRQVERDFGTVSEFFRDLLRAKMEQEIATDIAFLRSTVEGAEAGPSQAELEEIIACQRKVRKELAGEGHI